jgi:hypothetical protein
MVLGPWGKDVLAGDRDGSPTTSESLESLVI